MASEKEWLLLTAERYSREDALREESSLPTNSRTVRQTEIQPDIQILGCIEVCFFSRYSKQRHETAEVAGVYPYFGGFYCNTIKNLHQVFAL